MDESNYLNNESEKKIFINIKTIINNTKVLSIIKKNLINYLEESILNLIINKLFSKRFILYKKLSIYLENDIIKKILNKLLPDKLSLYKSLHELLNKMNKTANLEYCLICNTLLCKHSIPKHQRIIMEMFENGRLFRLSGYYRMSYS
jgi:hypothetical protein